MNLPQDPVMLLSYVNTQLRDHYRSLDEFCQAAETSREALEARLQTIDYVYDPEQNAFR
jgi:hypothetical protein